MRNLPALVDHYLAEWRSKDWASAYHQLVEMGAVIVPLLREYFLGSRAPDLREAILDIGLQMHSGETLPLLEDGLADPHPQVWKKALDALVDLASPAALALLEASRTAESPRGMDPSERDAWLGEAIEQAWQASQQRERGRES